jgi:hypothetical protein
MTFPATEESLPAVSLDDIKWALNEFSARRDAYQLARNYYNGKHRLAFASEKLNSAFGRLFTAFADNLCPTVCETVKDRLKLDGFTVSTSQSVADELWRRNRLKVRANQVHLDALIDGDAYVILWPDPEGVPTFYPNRATTVVIEYDDEQPGYIIKAAKAWPDRDGKFRLTLYYRDRVEKYISRDKAQGGMPDRAETFIHYQANGETWPLDNPYGKVPVFHFGNRASIGSLGISELSEAIPVSDALNKSIADMLVASEFYGVPQRWAIGLDEDLTPEQAKKKYPLLAGGVWGTTNKETRFGEFTAADISKYIQISETFRKEIARVSRTPLHYFALEGTMPSGESLRVAESPLTKKVEDRTEAWGAVWSDAMRFALQIQGVGDTEPEPKWLNTETRDQTGEVQRAATKHKDLKIPLEQTWRELGYSEQQIKKMKIQAAEEASQAMQRQQQIINPNAANGANGNSEVVQ